MSAPTLEESTAPQVAQGGRVDGVEPRWRRPLTIGLIVLAAIVMLLASLTLWVRRQALSTENWTATSSELLQDDEVRHALSVYLVDQAFSTIDAAGQIREELPEPLQPLATRLAASLRAGAINVADEVLSRPAVQRTWRQANRLAHGTLIGVIDEKGGSGPESNVVINLGPLVADVQLQLGLDTEARSDLGRLVLIPEGKVEQVRTYVKILRGATLFLWFAVVALFAAAIWLARGWRLRAVAISGWAIVGVGLALLIIRRFAGNAIVDSLAGGTQAEASAADTWAIATTLLRDSAQAILAFGALIVAATWIAGGSRWAVALRARLAPIFRRNTAAVYGGFVLFALVLLLVLPTSGGRRIVGTLVLFAALLAGLEALRRQVLREDPGVPAATGQGDGGAPAPGA